MAHYPSVAAYMTAREERRARIQERYRATEAGKEAQRRARRKFKGKAAKARRVREAHEARQAAERDRLRAQIGLPPFALRVVAPDGTEAARDLERELGL